MLRALKNGRGLLRSLFGFNQRTFGGFLFQRSALLRRISGGFTHRACPALGLATKERYTKTCALYPRSQKRDRKSTRLNSSHGYISYAVFCLKKKKTKYNNI